MKRSIALAIVLAAGAAAAEPVVQIARNPARSADRGGALTPADLVGWANFQGFFSSQTIPTQFYGSFRFQMLDAQASALVENFSIQQAPARTGASLGVPNIPENGGLELLFNAYFAAYPDADFAIAWYTGGSGPASINATIQVPTTTLGPLGRCAAPDGALAQFNIVGSPNLSDGVVGAYFRGVVTQNELCMYADPSTAAGHAFLSLKNTAGQTTTKGLYPASFGLGVLAGAEAPGKFNDDSSRAWSQRICWLLTTDQYNSAVSAMAATPTYQLYDSALGGAENCASWAMSVAQSLGLPLPVSLNRVGVHDPWALSSFLGSQSGLLGNCGRINANSNPAPDRSSFPDNFSPVDALDFALNDPAGLAQMFDATAIDLALDPVAIVSSGQVTVAIDRSATGSAAAIVDWGDGAEDFAPGAQVSHAYTADGVYQLRVGVIEQGSVQRYTAEVTVSGAGASAALVEIDVAGFEASIIENGPFVEPADPPFQDVTTCATDCNANGIPDCEEGAVSLDCNANGILDACDIASGFSLDADGDGVPDDCRTCLGDVTGDLLIDFSDLNAVIVAFGSSGPDLPADLDGDGLVNFDDLNEVLVFFGGSCLD